MPLDSGRATEIGVLSQLESNLGDIDKKSTKVESKGGKPYAVSGGRFHLLSPNIQDTLDNMGGRDIVSQAFLDSWDQSSKLSDPDKVYAQQGILFQHPNDATSLGSLWMQRVQQTAQYGYTTPVPRIMAWQSPNVVAKTIGKLTGVSDPSLNAANGAWTVYEQKWGREQAEKNLLDQIIQDYPGSDMAGRARRLLNEKVDLPGMKGVTLFEALQHDNIDPAQLPGDLRGLFTSLDPLQPDNDITQAIAQFNQEESQFMQLQRENGVPVDEPVFKLSNLLDLMMKPGDRSRSEVVRSLARMGLSSSGIGPDDIPERVTTEQLAEVILGDFAKDAKPLSLKEDEPVLPQVVDWLVAQGEITAKFITQNNLAVVGEGLDPLTYVGLGITKRIASWLGNVKYHQSIHKAQKAMEKIKRQNLGVDLGKVNEDFVRNLETLQDPGQTLAKRVDNLLRNVPDFIDKVKLLHPNQTLNDAQLGRLALEINDQGMKIIEFVRQAGPQSFTDIGLQKQLTEMIADFYTLVAPRQGAKSAVGRSLGSLEDEAAIGSDRFAEQFMKLTSRFVDPSKAAHHIAQFQDPAALAMHIKNVTRPGWGKMYNEILVNGLLSGPMTLLGVNPLGNGLAYTLQLSQRQVAGLFGKGGVPASEAARMAYYSLAAIPSAWRTFWKLSTGNNAQISTLVRGRHSKIDLERFASITGENFPNAPEWLKGWIDHFGNVVRLPTRLMVSQDEATKAIFYQGELAAQAGRLARESTGWESMSLTQRHARVKSILKDMQVNPHQYQDANKAARHTALQNTFTAPGGPTMEALVDFTNSHPFWKTIFPFVRTPINILKRVKHDLALDGKTFKAMRSSDKAVRDEALGRFTVASGLLASVAGLTQSGILVGGRGPADPKVRRMMREQLGREQGALAFDTDGDGMADRYLLLNTRTHVGQMLNIMGNLVELRGYLQDDQAGAYDNIVPHLMGAVADLIGEAPFMESVGDFMELLKQADERGWDGVKSHLARTGATYAMPLFVGARGQIRRAIDPIKRDTTAEFDISDEGLALNLVGNMVEAIKNQTPGFSEDLLPDHNMFGRVLEYPLGMGPGDMEGDATARLINAFLPIWNTTKISHGIPKDELEISQWMYNNDVVVRQPSREYKGIRIPNNLYQQWKVLAGRGDLIDPNTGEVIDKGALPGMVEMLGLVVESGDTTPIYDTRTGKITTDQITQFQNTYSTQLNTALQLLLVSPEWSQILTQSINNEASVGERELSSNPTQRNLSGIPLR